MQVRVRHRKPRPERRSWRDGRAASPGSRAAIWQVAGLAATFVVGLAGGRMGCWNRSPARWRRERILVRDGHPSQPRFRARPTHCIAIHYCRQGAFSWTQE